MPAVTRELQVTYNGVTIGGSTDYLVDGWQYVRKAYTQGEFEVSFVVTGSTAAAFASACSTIETAFRTPRQDLTVTLSGQSLIALKQSDNTGLDADPVLEKKGDPADTGRSRRYALRIGFTMPADNVAVSGLQQSRVNVTYTPARKKRLIISGTVTAVPGGSTARAQYEGLIDAFAAAAISAIGGTFELAEEPEAEHNSTNKTMTFVRVYDEIIYSQGGSIDDAGIVRPSLHIIKEAEAQTEAPGAVPLATCTATYEFWVDKEVTQNLTGKYQSIRNWLIGQMATVLGSSGSLVSEQVDYDRTENKVSARLVMKGLNGSKVVAYHLVTKITEHLGKVLVPVWNGDPYGRFAYQGPKEKTRVTTRTARVLGLPGPEDPFSPFTELFQYPLVGSENEGVWTLMVRETSASPIQIGLPGEERFYSDIEEAITEQFYVPAKAASSQDGAPIPT